MVIWLEIEKTRNWETKKQRPEYAYMAKYARQTREYAQPQASSCAAVWNSSGLVFPARASMSSE
jgi:hypothetical protein